MNAKYHQEISIVFRKNSYIVIDILTTNGNGDMFLVDIVAALTLANVNTAIIILYIGDGERTVLYRCAIRQMAALLAPVHRNWNLRNLDKIMY